MENVLANPEFIIKSDRGDVAMVGLDIDDPDPAFCASFVNAR